MTKKEIPIAGKKIRDRSVTLTDGSSVKLSSLSAENGLILYFYPKDNTTGCTTEANGFNEMLDHYKREGFSIAGVSPDSPSSHKKFTDKCSLAFPLIADEKRDLCGDFGVWAEKSMYGKKYMGVLRTTFVLNRDLKLMKVYEKVKPAGHAQAILDEIKAKKFVD